ncbi:MAG: hypothetical protein IKW33_05255 [Clostridia bacterium]|nr:hypothetical protein [Clostridia bacterium]
MKKFFENIKNDRKKLVKIGIILIVVLFALLIVFSSFNNNENTQVNTSNNYVSDLENRLSKTLSKVEGAGNVYVVITVESGMETVLASETVKTEENGKITTTSKPILVGGKTVVIKENFPKIIGVVIVCQGANNISVYTKIEQATASLLNIDTKKIEILKAN